MTPQQRWRRAAKEVLLKRNGYQFGQPPATCTLVTRSVPGDVACADTSIQMVLRLVPHGRTKQRRWYSLNFIRLRSKMMADRPMNVANARMALLSFGLPYVVRTSITAREVMAIARNKGPVLIAEDYWAHPQKHGGTYAGRTLDGYARNSRGSRVKVGFAKFRDRLGIAGNRQWTFRDGHMVLVVSSQRRNGRYFAIVRDPNHNSASRPERPAWDELDGAQLGRMLRSFNGSRNIVAIVPTRRIWR